MSSNVFEGMDIERFHNQLALHLGYKRILDRNIDIYVNDSKGSDDFWITIEVKKPSMKIRFNPSMGSETDDWTSQITNAKKRQFIDLNIKQQINDIIVKANRAYVETNRKKY